MNVEMQQVRLRLTQNKKVLGALRKRNRLTEEKSSDEFPNGCERFTLQFDGNDFDFRTGVVITVGQSVGKALLRDSLVIVDDDLTGEQLPGLDLLSSHTIGDRVDPNVTKDFCPVCGETGLTTQESVLKHMAGKHMDEIQKAGPSKQFVQAHAPAVAASKQGA